jgi:ornithine cyclodeaminase
VPVREASSVEEAVADADLVLAVTDATEPILFPGMVGPGCLILSVDAAGAGLRELSGALVRQSGLFCDDRARAVAAGIPAEQIVAELGEVIGGKHPGRRSSDEVILYASFGLPHSLLAAASLAFESARDDDSLPRVDGPLPE